MNLMEVSIEKDSNGNPTCIIWPDGRRFSISSSGRHSCARRGQRAGSHMSATSMSSVAAIGTHRRSLIADGGKWYVVCLK